LIPEFTNNPDLVKQIVAARSFHPFTQVTDMMNLPGVGQYSGRLSPLITTRSNYFLITGQGSFAGAKRRIYASVRRNSNGSAMLISWHED
jgi:hypothetical protein